MLELSDRVRRCVALLLLATVPAYGMSAVLLTALGPTHRHAHSTAERPHVHAPQAERAGWLRDAVAGLIGPRATAAWEATRLQVSLHEERTANPHHHHGLFEHHHHPPGDSSVQVLGASEAAALTDLAMSGSACLPFLTSITVNPMALGVYRGIWPESTPHSWSNACVSLLERPPRG